MAFVDGVFYTDEGQGEPIIFLHGLGGRHELMRVHADKIREEGFRTILIDFPLMGKSTKQAKKTDDLTQSVRTVLDHLNVEKASLYGYSLGAGIAIDFASKHGNRVNKMVIIGAAKKMMILSELRLIIRYLREVVKGNLDNKSFRHYHYRKMYTEGTDEKIIQAKYEDAKKTPGTKIMKYLSFIIRAGSLKPEDVDAKTLIFGAREDVLIPLKHTKKLSQEIKNSRLSLLDDCNHMLFYEQADEIVRQAVGFMKEK